MRFAFIAAVSTLALAAAAPALAQDAAAPAAPTAASTSGELTDAQLTSFNEAMVKIKGVSASGTPTPEQQAEMAAAIEASGLGIEQFNAISARVSSDEVLQARLGVIAAPAPTAGSVSAGVSDAEVEKFSAVMVQMREIAPNPGAAPTPEQQTQMASAVEESGLALDRFNAIATAVSQDAHLRARVQLADAKRG